MTCSTYPTSCLKLICHVKSENLNSTLMTAPKHNYSNPKIPNLLHS